MSPLLLTLVLAVTPLSPNALQSETDAFHRARLERLKANGWLNLVALLWIKEGDNAAGSAKDAALKFPAAAPAHLGTFTRKGAEVSFTPAPGVAVTHGGKPFPGGKLVTDADGDPTELRAGTFHFYVINRQGDLGVRVKDDDAATAKAFTDIPRYPANAAWRVTGKLVRGAGHTTLAVPNVLGKVEAVESPGVVELTVEGKTFRLAPTMENGEYFFVFGDLTNRDTTYGAGRFLNTPPADKDGNVVLDFNHAVNPPCAFSAFATCPLPPKENRLSARVEAGEKRMPGAHP